MPLRQIYLCSAIILFFCTVLIFSIYYGPSQRISISAPNVIPVGSSYQLENVWQSSGVKGRTLILFTRYLNAVEAMESKELKATERAMELGIVRRVFHIVPDRSWKEVSKNLEGRKGIYQTKDGFIGVFEFGRVYIQPLSHFTPPLEQSLVVVEPKVWSEDDFTQIIGYLDQGLPAR